MEFLTVGLAQIVPVWLDRERTLAKLLDVASDAGARNCQLVVLGGEACVPGYPFWLELTDGAVFNSQIQKELFAEYARQAVQIERGDLEPLCALAREKRMAMYVGIIERPMLRGGKSLYCALVQIDAGGTIASVQRKLMPTFEERLVWSIGDGNGLRVHSIGAFTVGGLNCWENWMPLARTALYAQGEDFHVCVFPGSRRNTHDITRFIAKEARSFAASVSCFVRKCDLPPGTLHLERIRERAPEVLADGGTCLAGPDGEWVIEPCAGEEKLLVATIDHRRVREERQNFDCVGHYARPDVFRLTVNRERQAAARFFDESDVAR